MDKRRIRELADTTSLSKFSKKMNRGKKLGVDNNMNKRKIPSLILNARLIEALIGDSTDVKLPKVLLAAKPQCDEYTIDVRNCGITSIDGYGSKASNVRILDVSFNRLSDLDKLEGLKQLREIRAHNNVLGPELMDSYVFDGTPNLEVVYLNGNNLVRFPSCLHVLRKLREIRLNTNIMEKLTPGILKLSSCRNLEFVDLGGNQLSTLAGLEALGGSIKTLILRNNNLKELHKSIGQLPKLEELDLGANRLTSLKELQKLCNKMNISILRVDRNRICDWKNVPRLDSLTEFHASNNRFSTIEPIMNKFKDVDVIDLSDNRVSDEADVFKLQRIDGLVSLSLSGNPISHEEKIAERLCKALKTLAVYDGYSVSRFGGDDTFEPPGLPLASADATNENKENSTSYGVGGDGVSSVRRKLKHKDIKLSRFNVATGKCKQLNGSTSKRRKEASKKSYTNESTCTIKNKEVIDQSFSSVGNDEVVESLFSDRSRHAPSKANKKKTTSSSSSLSFTRALVETIFEDDDDDDNDSDTTRPTPRMMSSRRSKNVLGGYSNNGVKALDDVDALAENYRKKIQIVQRKHVSNFEFAKLTSSSRPSSSASTKSPIALVNLQNTNSKTFNSTQNSSSYDSDSNSSGTARSEYSAGVTEYGVKVQAGKALPKSTLAEALKYARTSTGEETCKVNDREDEGKSNEKPNEDPDAAYLKLNLSKLTAGGKSGLEADLDEDKSENDEMPIIVVTNTLLNQVLSDKSKAWRPPSARQKKGFRGFKIPKRAKAYVHTHLDKK